MRRTTTCGSWCLPGRAAEAPYWYQIAIGGREGDGVGAHREPADGRGVGGQHGGEGVGDEHHAIGTARRLLGVDEPVAALPGLEDELAPLHAVSEKVLDQRGVHSTRPMTAAV